jgi:hypothetical protein
MAGGDPGIFRGGGIHRIQRVETATMDASVILTFVVVGAATLCVLVWSGY